MKSKFQLHKQDSFRSYKNIRSYRLFLVSTALASFCLCVFPYLFLAQNPWSADVLSNELPVIHRITSQTHAQLPQSFLPAIISSVVVSVTGTHGSTVLSLFPQFLFAVGVYVFGRFTTKYVNHETVGIWAALILGSFGPTVYWAAQGVRESYALAAIPWVLWAVWIFLKRKSVTSWLVLFISATFITFTHHWSSFMLIIGLTPVLLIATLRIGYSPLIAAATISGVFSIYWIGISDFVRDLLMKGVITLSGALGYGSGSTSSTGDGGVGGASTASMGIFDSIQQILVFSRPPQMFLGFLFVALISTAGTCLALYNRDSKFAITGIAAGSIGLLFGAGVIIGSNFSVFDPLRTIEFLSFPAAIAGGYTLTKLSQYQRSSFTTLMSVVIAGFLVLSAVAFYPAPYYGVQQADVDSPYYDIRGDLFYVSTGDEAALEFADAQQYRLQAPFISTINLQSEYIYNLRGPCTMWLTPSVNRVIRGQSNVQAPYMKADQEAYIRAQRNGDLIYSNDRGRLYTMKESGFCN